MTDQKQCFSKNLTIACASQRSVSQVCREIGVNRPQFARYLKGDSLPSANNLLKIANFFQLAEADFFLSERDFRMRFERRNRARLKDARDMVLDAFRNQDGKLLELAGFYHSYYVSSAWRGHVVCGLAEIRIEQGFALTRGMLRTPKRGRRALNKIRYHGMMTAGRDHVFLLEKSNIAEGLLCETIFERTPNSAERVLCGQLMSVSPAAEQSIFTSPVIWRPLAPQMSLRDALARCGVYAPESADLPDQVRRYLQKSG